MVYALIMAALAFLALLVLQSKVPLRYNWRNVAVRWRTTAMTALAFTVVIGLLTVMLGFVNGMYRLTLASGQPGNVIVLSERATDEVVSNLMPADVGDLERQQGIVRENDRPLASRETYLVVNQPIPNAPAKGLRRRFLQVRGLDDPVIAGRVHNLELSPGGAWFSEAGVREASASGDGQTAAQEYVEAVLGEGVAGELGRDRTPEQRPAPATRNASTSGTRSRWVAARGSSPAFCSRPARRSTPKCGPSGRSWPACSAKRLILRSSSARATPGKPSA